MGGWKWREEERGETRILDAGRVSRETSGGIVDAACVQQRRADVISSARPSMTLEGDILFLEMLMVLAFFEIDHGSNYDCCCQ